MIKGKVVRTTISLPEGLYTKASAHATELHFATFSDYVQHLIRTYSPNPEPEPKSLQLAEKNPNLTVEKLNQLYAAAGNKASIKYSQRRQKNDTRHK